MGHSQACSQVSQWAPGALLRSAAGAVASEAEPFTGLCPPGRRAGQGGTAGPPGSLCFRCRARRRGGLRQSSALPPAPPPPQRCQVFLPTGEEAMEWAGGSVSTSSGFQATCSPHHPGQQHSAPPVGQPGAPSVPGCPLLGRGGPPEEGTAELAPVSFSDCCWQREIRRVRLLSRRLAELVYYF